MSIPVLDYSHFSSGSREQRETFAHALVESFEKTGFCKLEYHGFDSKQLSEMFDWVCLSLTFLFSFHGWLILSKARKFFDQPIDTKQKIPNDIGPKPMRGYTPWRVEEVGKLSFDNMVRSLKDSKVCHFTLF
jgi:isopenicillin N synthase-like dioxygenase